MYYSPTFVKFQLVALRIIRYAAKYNFSIIRYLLSDAKQALWKHCAIAAPFEVFFTLYLFTPPIVNENSSGNEKTIDFTGFFAICSHYSHGSHKFFAYMQQMKLLISS